MGGIGPLVLVYKISKFVHVVDIHSMQTFEIDNAMYWKNSFTSLLTRERLSEFIVLDIEDMDTNMNDSRAALKQKFRQVKVQVARKADLGVNETTYWVNTHLGEVLTFNDSVLGYDLEWANNETIDNIKLKLHWLPEVILVKKIFPKYRRKRGTEKRSWNLKHLAKEYVEEEPDELAVQAAKGKKEKITKVKQNKLFERQAQDREKDYEIFLQDLEEDKEYRGHVHMYVDANKEATTDKKEVEQVKTAEGKQDDEWETDSDVETDAPLVSQMDLLKATAVKDNIDYKIDVHGEPEEEEEKQ